jgi:hypothetical protein
MFRGLRLLIGAVAMTALAGAIALPADAQPGTDPASAAACGAFEAGIGEYAALHQRLERRWPPLRPTTDMEAVMLNRQRLASAIKAERPDAREGDIFTAPVAACFRATIAHALENRDPEALLQDLFGEQPALGTSHLRVYEPYPDWATHEVPVVLLQHLPALPQDIEYRVFDHDLVLWDSHANLIVDVLPNAIGLPAS